MLTGSRTDHRTEKWSCERFNDVPTTTILTLDTPRYPKVRPQIHLAPVNTEKERETPLLPVILSLSFSCSRKLFIPLLLFAPLQSLLFSRETYFASPRGLPDPKLEKKGHTPCHRFTPHRVRVYIVLYGHCVIAKSLSIFGPAFLDRRSPAN